MTAPRALRSGLRLISRDDERGFVLRLALLTVAVLGLVGLLSILPLSGPLRYLVPGSAAALITLTFVRRPAEALLVFALLVLFSRTLAVAIGNTINQIDEIAVGLLFLVALGRVWSRWREWLWPPRELAVAGVLALGVVSSLAANVPLEIWPIALVLLGKSIAFLYTVTWTRFRPFEIRAGMTIVLAVGSAVLAMGFVELLNPQAFQQFFGLPQSGQREGLPVMKSLFVHPVLFAWFMAFVSLFLYAQFITTRRWRWLIAAVLFTLGPFLATRRRAILALWAGLAAAFIESLRRSRRPTVLLRAWAPVAATTVLVAVVFMPALTGLYRSTLQTYISELPGVARQTPSPPPMASPPPGSDPQPEASPVPAVVAGEITQARTALYVGSLEIARDHFPLGGGLGRYASWMTRVHYSPLYYEYGLNRIHGLAPRNPVFVTDTFWPQILGELGVVALAAYVAFVASLAYMLWREAAKATGPLARLLTLAAGMVFTQALVESLASAMFHSPPRIYLVYLAIGAVASMAWRSRQEPAQEVVPQ
jgi:hypothetical protein